MAFELIRLSEGEWQAAKALRLEAVKNSPCAFGQNDAEAEAVPEAKWRSDLRDGSYLFARVGDKLVGLACLKPEPQEKLRHGAWIYSVYVAPEMRGQGIGRALIEKLIADALVKYPHLIKVMLNATTAQSSAIALYESLGFKKVGLLEKHLKLDGKYYDEWSMVKFVR